MSVGLELYKSARLTQAESTKDATLANDPCTQNEDDYDFTVANYNDTVAASARERYLGLTNRVIAGMLLQTTRTTPVNCTDSRFSDIESLCKGGELRQLNCVFLLSTLPSHKVVTPEMQSCWRYACCSPEFCGLLPVIVNWCL